jgi:hypothetical protein
MMKEGCHVDQGDVLVLGVLAVALCIQVMMTRYMRCASCFSDNASGSPGASQP